MVGPGHVKLRWRGTATLHHVAATVGKAATTKLLVEQRHRTRNGSQLTTTLAGIGQGVKQVGRVRVQGLGEKLPGLGDFNDLARVHQRHPMRHL